MKIINLTKLILFILLFIGAIRKDTEFHFNSLLIDTTRIPLEANNIKSYILGSGVFDAGTNNAAGFEWPKGTGKKAIFTSGLTIGTYINNQIRFASALYLGEFAPGYCNNSIGQTNSNFKFYRIARGDNQFTNPDWLNWGLMVPYGAPYVDVNNSGYYESSIDTPGVKGAAQTIFVCLTDAFPQNHSNITGFGGGTLPIFAEIHLTAWCYDQQELGDIQFLKWVIINKNTNAWDSTIISIPSDPDLGWADDDYIGCDSTMNLGFCYNADNDDFGVPWAYGINPPAVGIMFLNCSVSNAKLSSFVLIGRSSTPEPICEREPNESLQAYNLMKGLKNDGTPWINPVTFQSTKFCYSYPGWTEFMGKINNCNDSLIGPVVQSVPGDRKFSMNFKPANQRLNPLDSHVVIASQLIGRGNNNLHSITMLLSLAEIAKNLCQNGFVIGINPISKEIPSKFNLYQNYPNPFNPVTKIRFDMPLSDNVTIKVYDIMGKEIITLVNEKLQAGEYGVYWDASYYPSGIYFFQLQTKNFTETKKIVLIK